MNTVPYTNARREGRTSPGKIEFITPDPRYSSRKPQNPNRAMLRSRGIGVRQPRRLKVAHPRCEDCGRLVPTYRTPPLCAACATARKVERHA